MNNKKLQELKDIQYLLSDVIKYLERDKTYGAYLTTSNAVLARKLIDSMIEEKDEKIESSVYVFDENNEGIRHFIA